MLIAYKQLRKVKVGSGYNIDKTIRKQRKLKKKLERRHQRFIKKYTKYIDSEEWKIRRTRYFETHPHRCAVCGKWRDIQLHHKTYSNLGKEKDNELVPLCFYHHEKYHRENPKTSIKTTDKFIRKEKKKYADKRNHPKETKPF